MKRDCLQVENEIWEHVQHGHAISDESRQHISECAQCARAQRETEKIQQAIITSKHTPDAPDCRLAVLAKISGRKAVPAWGWAGVCAAVVAATVIGWSILAVPHPKPQYEPGTKIVKQAPAKPEIVEQPQVKHEEPKQELTADNKQIDPGGAEKQQTVYHKLKRPYQPRPEKLNPTKPDEVKQIAKSPNNTSAPATAQDVLEDENRSVAIAIVKFDGDEPSDYSYTQQNIQTGATTTCTVRRSENAVEIYMETREEDKNPKTIKGNIDNETNRNV